MKSADERLHDALSHAGGDEPSDDGLRALGRAAREELAAHPKARAWWVDALVVLALNLAMGLGAVAATSWSTQQHASPLLRTVVVASWLVLMVLGSVSWLRPGGHLGRWLVSASFIGASLLTVLGASGFDPGQPFLRGISCAVVECSLAVLPLSASLALSTRFAASGWHLFTAGLSSAAGGALALHLHCANGTLSHLVAFHLLPALVLGGLAVLARRVLRPRSFAP